MTFLAQEALCSAMGHVVAETLEGHVLALSFPRTGHVVAGFSVTLVGNMTASFGGHVLAWALRFMGPRRAEGRGALIDRIRSCLRLFLRVEISRCT